MYFFNSWIHEPDILYKLSSLLDLYKRFVKVENILTSFITECEFFKSGSVRFKYLNFTNFQNNELGMF